MGITDIRQCLAIFEHGSGVSESVVLPHEWTKAFAALGDHPSETRDGGISS
jgi:hypothetical protein